MMVAGAENMTEGTMTVTTSFKLPMDGDWPEEVIRKNLWVGFLGAVIDATQGGRGLEMSYTFTEEG
jgi:hypothetical protein